jgi:hypothetical protein
MIIGTEGKELILKNAFLIRESFDGNTHFDFP